MIDDDNFYRLDERMMVNDSFSVSSFSKRAQT